MDIENFKLIYLREVQATFILALGTLDPMYIIELLVGASVLRCFNDSIPLSQTTIPIIRHAIHMVITTTYQRLEDSGYSRVDFSEMIDRLGGLHLRLPSLRDYLSWTKLGFEIRPTVTKTSSSHGITRSSKSGPTLRREDGRCWRLLDGSLLGGASGRLIIVPTDHHQERPWVGKTTVGDSARCTQLKIKEGVRLLYSITRPWADRGAAIGLNQMHLLVQVLTCA